MAGNQKLNATITIGGAVSATLSKAIGTVNAKLGSIGVGIGGGFAQNQARIGAAIERNAAALDNARAGIFDAIGAYYALKGALGAPIQSSLQMEEALSDLGIKSGATAAELEALRLSAREASVQVGQATADLIKGADYLVGMGMSLDDSKVAMVSIGKAATATKADVLDLSQAGYAAMVNLGVAAADLEKAFGAMNAAGKMGGFELRAMAQYMPALGAAYQTYGQQGVDAVADLSAALQVTRKDTGDDSTAATNLQNLIQKIYSPATIKKFSDQGVDLMAELEKAAQKGLTPLEAIANITEETLGGDLTKLGFLFEDAQAQAAARSLIQHREEYIRIREEAEEAISVEEDFQKAMQTTAKKIKKLFISVENLSESFGKALTPAIGQLTEQLGPVLVKVGEWIEANPELVSQIALAVGGLVAFKGALAAIRFVGLLGQGGALQLLAFGMGTVGRAAAHLWGAARASVALQAALGAMSGQKLAFLPKIGTALYGMAAAVPGMTMLGQALGAIGAAVAGIGAGTLAAFAAVAALVAAAGFSIWKYWDRVSSVFSGVAKRVAEEFQPALDAVRPVLDWLQPIGDKIAGAWERVGAAFDYVTDAVSSIDLGGLFSQEVLTPEQIANGEKMGYQLADRIITGIKTPFVKLEELEGKMLTLGGEILQSLWDGMKAKFGEFIGWVQSIPGKIFEAIGNIDLSNAIKFPSLPTWLGGEPAPALAAENVRGKAVGGSFPKGPVIVGERGPELRFEDRAGFIATNRQLERMRGAAEVVSRAAAPQFARAPAAAPRINLGGITINAPAGMDPRRIADEVMRTIEARMRGALFDGGR